MYRFPLSVKSAIVLVSLLCLAAGSPVWANEVRMAESCIPVKDSYLVKLRTTQEQLMLSVEGRAQALGEQYRGHVKSIYQHTIPGFSVAMTAEDAAWLAKDPGVEFVEQDCWGGVTSTQINPPWGLDRIDQRHLPLDQSYTANQNGSGVHVYVVDSGIDSTHPDLAERVGNGFRIFGGSPEDCYGHGTHVAGIIGGTTHGVAKGVTLHSVSVVQCLNGRGYASWAADGVEWITAHRQEPAVVNMSVSYPDVFDPTGTGFLDQMVQASIDSGLTYVVGSGNDFADACNNSPGGVADAITVGATDISDTRPAFSNDGTCVDLHAPGVDVLSACPASLPAFCEVGCDEVGNDTSFCSGTSMASPHVAGLAARFLAAYPGASPATVHQAMVDNATTGVVSHVGNSPNRSAYSGFLDTSNLPPVAVDDAIEVMPGTSCMTVSLGDMLSNDLDPEGDPLRILGYSQASHGSVMQHVGGARYCPSASFWNPCRDSFDYTITDGPSGGGGTDIGTVHLRCELQHLFSDDFESQDLSAWSFPAAFGSATIDTVAVGSNTAMTVHVTGVAGDRAFVADHTPNRQKAYRASFENFVPDSSLTPGDTYTLLVADDLTTYENLVIMMVRRHPQNQASQLRVFVRQDNNSWFLTPWFNYATSTLHTVEFDWWASSGANDGGLTLWIDGTQVFEVDHLDNDDGRIDIFKLGIINHQATSVPGDFYFDNFTSSGY